MNISTKEGIPKKKWLLISLEFSCLVLHWKIKKFWSLKMKILGFCFFNPKKAKWKFLLFRIEANVEFRRVLWWNFLQNGIRSLVSNSGRNFCRSFFTGSNCIRKRNQLRHKIFASQFESEKRKNFRRRFTVLSQINPLWNNSPFKIAYKNLFFFCPGQLFEAILNCLK